MPGRPEGSVALITGAARGMGAAEAELFVAEGARVAVADVLVDDGDAVVERLGAAAMFVELDLTDEAAWASAVETATAWGGRIDILVNNAGIGHVRPLAPLTVPPMGRIGRPDEVARPVVFLASSEISYCTGAEFVIDGGLTVGGVNSVERAWIAKALGVEARS